jgi:hypothetical protein
MFTLPGLELPLPLVVQPVASRYTDWAIPAHVFIDKEYIIRRACSTNEGEEECIEDIGGKARRKDIIRKTKT